MRNGKKNNIKENKLLNNRNYNIDVLKGLAIIFVLIGHSIQYGSGYDYNHNQLFFDNFLFKTIYSFHMPLFMVISGYLFYYTINKYSTKEIIQKKIKELLIPIISFSIVELLILFINGNISGGTILNALISPLWFLWAVLLLSFLTLIINRKLKDSIIIYIIIFILTFFAPKLFNVHLYAYTYPFFILGYEINRFNILLNRNITKVFLFILMFMYIKLFKHFNFDSYIYTSGMNIINSFNQITIDIYRLIIGILGSAIVVLFVIIVDLKHVNKFVVFISKNTLGIYAISNFVFKYVRIITHNLNSINYLLLIVEVIITMLICICLIKVIKSNNLTSKLFLGCYK